MSGGGSAALSPENFWQLRGRPQSCDSESTPPLISSPWDGGVPSVRPRVSAYRGISSGITESDAGVSPRPGMRGERPAAGPVTPWGPSRTLIPSAVGTGTLAK